MTPICDESSLLRIVGVRNVSCEFLEMCESGGHISTTMEGPLQAS